MSFFHIGKKKCTFEIIYVGQNSLISILIYVLFKCSLLQEIIHFVLSTVFKKPSFSISELHSTSDGVVWSDIGNSVQQLPYIWHVSTDYNVLLRVPWCQVRQQVFAHCPRLCHPVHPCYIHRYFCRQPKPRTSVGDRHVVIPC